MGNMEIWEKKIPINHGLLMLNMAVEIWENYPIDSGDMAIMMR